MAGRNLPAISYLFPNLQSYVTSSRHFLYSTFFPLSFVLYYSAVPQPLQFFPKHTPLRHIGLKSSLLQTLIII